MRGTRHERGFRRSVKGLPAPTTGAALSADEGRLR